MDWASSAAALAAATISSSGSSSCCSGKGTNGEGGFAAGDWETCDAADSALCFSDRNCSARRLASKAADAKSDGAGAGFVGKGGFEEGAAGAGVGGTPAAWAPTPIFAARFRFFLTTFGTAEAPPKVTPAPAGIPPGLEAMGLSTTGGVIGGGAGAGGAAEERKSKPEEAGAAGLASSGSLTTAGGSLDKKLNPDMAGAGASAAGLSSSSLDAVGVERNEKALFVAMIAGAGGLVGADCGGVSAAGAGAEFRNEKEEEAGAGSGADAGAGELRNEKPEAAGAGAGAVDALSSFFFKSNPPNIVPLIYRR